MECAVAYVAWFVCEVLRKLGNNSSTQLSYSLKSKTAVFISLGSVGVSLVSSLLPLSHFHRCKGFKYHHYADKSVLKCTQEAFCLFVCFFVWWGQQIRNNCHWKVARYSWFSRGRTCYLMPGHMKKHQGQSRGRRGQGKARADAFTVIFTGMDGEVG